MSLKSLLYSRLTRKYSPDYFWNTRTKAMAGGIFARIRYPKLQAMHNCSIPFTVKFAGKPIFPHGLSGIFISRDAVIGENCVIFQQVTIGSNTASGSKGIGAPTLGDRVYIGAGAKIIGGITVGSDARIGANCVVVKDVPANATVVSAPVRVLTRESAPDNRFIPKQDLK